MVKLSCWATSDHTRDQSNSNYYVSLNYPPLKFSIDFNPEKPDWNKMRKRIAGEISKQFQDGRRKWVWGVFGMDGRVSKFKLYDWYKATGNTTFQVHRQGFVDAVSKSGSNLSLKVKWSCEHDLLIAQADLRTADTNARIAESIQERKKVYILEYSRVPESFENALLTCADLERCRKGMNDNGADGAEEDDYVKHRSGAKVLVAPELYVATVREMERDGEKFQSRHVVVSGEFLENVRTVVTRDIKKADKVKEKSCDELQILPPVQVQNSFLTVRLPRSEPSSGSAHPVSAP